MSWTAWNGAVDSDSRFERLSQEDLADLLEDIESQDVASRDEMLTERLVRAYPTKATQDN